MSPTEWHRAEDEAYRERIRGYTLSELEDVFAHLDRTGYPQRFEMVRQELDRRIQGLDARAGMPDEVAAGSAGLFRRVWGRPASQTVAWPTSGIDCGIFQR